METKREQRVKDLIESMKRERGYLPPPWPYATEKDIDFMEAYNKAYNICLNNEKGLPIKTRELIAIAIIAFRGLEGGLYEHMKRALRHGATKQEIFEALKVSFIFSGTPTFVIGLQALLKIEEEGRKE